VGKDSKVNCFQIDLVGLLRMNDASASGVNQKQGTVPGNDFAASPYSWPKAEANERTFVGRRQQTPIPVDAGQTFCKALPQHAGLESIRALCE
jgi:hypothetical protein